MSAESVLSFIFIALSVVLGLMVMLGLISLMAIGLLEIWKGLFSSIMDFWDRWGRQ